MPAIETWPSESLAGWWSRVFAETLDLLIVGTPAAIVAVAGTFAVLASHNSGSDLALIAAIVIALIVLVAMLVPALLYAPYLMARTNGQTIGKRLAGIRVVRAGGEPVTFGFAAHREIVVKTLGVGLAAHLTFGLASAVDCLWPLWDDQNRALHDIVANTRVVRARG